MKLTCITDAFKQLEKGKEYEVEEQKISSLEFGKRVKIEVKYPMVKINGRRYEKNMFSGDYVPEEPPVTVAGEEELAGVDEFDDTDF